MSSSAQDFFPDDAEECILEDCDIPYLFSFIQSRLFIKKQGYSLRQSDSKAFYKIRHNVFKTYLSFVCSITSSEEKPFSYYHLCDSNRTPDYIDYDADNGKVILLEFSVSNTKKASIENKESYGKYNEECSLIRSKGIEVLDRYFCMSLDSDVSELSENVTTFLSQTGQYIIEDLVPSLTHLKDEFLYLNWHINEVMPELLMNRDYTPNVKLRQPPISVPQVFNTCERLAGVSRSKNIFLKKRIKMKSRELLRSFKRKSRTFRFQINYNFKDDILYVSLDEDGLDKDTIMSMLLTEDDNLIEHVNVIGSYDYLPEPFNRYGESTVDLESTSRSKNKVTMLEENYSDHLLYRIKRVETKTLSDYPLDEESLKVKNFYMEILDKKRSDTRNVVFMKKSPFIFVPVHGLVEGEYSMSLSSKYPLTQTLLRSSVKPMGNQIIDRNIDYDKLIETESEMSKSWGKIKHIQNVKKLLRSGEISDPEVTIEEREMIMNYKNLKTSFSDSVYEAKRTTYKNRVNISLSRFKKEFPLEMEHYNRKSNVTYMYPDSDLEELEDSYKTLIEEMFEKSDLKTRDQIFSDTEVQGVNLAKTTMEMNALIKAREDEYLFTNLSSNTLFISRLCYSLLYYSNIKLNKNDFCLDNLGYANCLLIVRGGSKILKTRRSRLFKLIVPISSNTSGLLNMTSAEKQIIDGIIYITLPWRQFGQSILKKGLELHNSFGNYFIANGLESGLSKDEWEKFTSLKILNMFSQKRKMEVWFSSLRYIYFNSTGTHSDVLKLVESMVEPDYDSYFYMIQRLFAKNYRSLYEAVKEDKIYDLFYGITYDNFDLCYEKFEETAYMAKCPVDPVNEHLGNLKRVLEIHDYFISNYGTYDAMEILEKSKVDLSSPEINNQLYSDDFKFDPKLCFLIGKYASNLISTSTTKSDLESEFSKIVSETFTNMATSKGMRGSEGVFWGEKGFDVVFNKLNLGNKVKSLVKEFPWDRKRLDDEIKETSKTYANVIEETVGFKMEFDMKDKSQYKGAREVYVMTDKTKLLQQPVENFMRVLCRYMPNELMHKKSHVRPKLIHRKVFENKEVLGKTMYTTLDCTKWAPKSNLWKYAYFVDAMSDILPESFIDYFKRVWSLMFKKVIRVQKKYYDLLETNESNKVLISHLKLREDGDYELLMPYSFMMGIFNFLSSLFHSASQLYFNSVISSPRDVHFNLMAHSDDSGGSVVAKSYESCLDMFSVYEKFQKCCNHLMSKKKSSLSDSSFELISIMYNKNRLIPMTHKFMTNVSIDPTGESWYNDICTVVGKVVDAFNNGASMVQCYCIMLSQGELLRKSYHLPRTKMLSAVPLHFGGLFNMHPIHLILLGSCAQEVMLDLVESPRMRDFRINTYMLFSGDYIIGRGCSLKTRLPYYVTHPNMLLLGEKENEVLNNLTFLTEKTTLTDAIKYYNGIKGNKFKYALLNVDTYKLLYSTLFYKLNILSQDGKKKCTLNDLCMNYVGFSIVGLKPKRNFLGYSNEINYMRASESIYINLDKVNIESKKSCKPMIYHTFMNLGLNLSFEDIASIKLFNIDEDYRKLLKNPKKWEAMTDWVLENLGEGEKSDKLKHLGIIERKDVEKLRSCYMFIPSGVNIDTVERFWTYSLMYCTRRRYISSDMPQFYTMEKFEFWKLPYDSLKHHYLLMKIAFEDVNLESNLKNYSDSMSNCGMCSSSDALNNTIEEIMKIKRLGPWERFETKLPFVTYTRPQYRGQNVWFGSTDFTLKTMFGEITHIVVDGKITTEWKLFQEAYLDQIWHLYKLFCDSRGVEKPNIVYDNTGFQIRRIAFNSLNMPFVPSQNDNQLILENSRIVNGDYRKLTLQTDWNCRPMYDNEFVDFNIYQIYDINESFFKSHNLDPVKNLILPKESSIGKSVLLNNFLESKLYKILMLDQTHKSSGNLNEKYKNIELLGSLGSFTRSLCLANEIGLVKYRSSVSMNKEKNSILESQTIQDIPLIDLYNASSMSRVTFQQQKTLMKMITDETLESKDFVVLDDMATKLGLVTSATMIVNYKAIIGRMDPSQFSKIPAAEKMKCVMVLIDCIHSCMEDYPNRKIQHQWEASKVSYWENMVGLLKNQEELVSQLKKKNEKRKVKQLVKLRPLALHITKGLFRACSDNEMRTWAIRRENILSSLLQISYLGAQNLYYTINSILRDVLTFCPDEFFGSMRNRKMVNKCKAGALYTELENEEFEEFEDDIMTSDITNFNCPSLITDEDGLDELSGRDIPEEYENRVWGKGQDELLILNNEADLIKAQAYTATRPFNSLKIYSYHDYINFSWLGPSDKKLEKLGKYTYYVNSYPGRYTASSRLDDDRLLIKQKSKEFNDAYETHIKKLEGLKEDEQVELDTNQYSEYFKECFREQNLYMTPHVKKWIYDKKTQLEDTINMVIKSLKKAPRIERRKKKNYLPGFSGVLRDDKVVSEMKSLFGEEFFFLSTGQVKINRKVHRMIWTLMKSLYFRVNRHHKGFLTLLFSFLRECIITDSDSDVKMTDLIFGYINDIQELYEEDIEDRDTSAPDPMQGTSLDEHYKVSYAVDWANIDNEPPEAKEEVE